MSTVIFVGMHNKIGKKPLCSTTRSGKLVDKIISKLHAIPCIKTNLYDIDYYPTNKDEKFNLAKDWHDRISPHVSDIIVLMGAEVHSNYITDKQNKVIKIAHPSSKRSHAEMDEYIKTTIVKIKEELK